MRTASAASRGRHALKGAGAWTSPGYLRCEVQVCGPQGSRGACVIHADYFSGHVLAGVAPVDPARTPNVELLACGQRAAEAVAKSPEKSDR